MNREEFMDRWDDYVGARRRNFSTDVDALIDAAVQAERERCAKLAENEMAAAHLPNDRWDMGYRRALEVLAAAIRFVDDPRGDAVPGVSVVAQGCRAPEQPNPSPDVSDAEGGT